MLTAEEIKKVERIEIKTPVQGYLTRVMVETNRNCIYIYTDAAGKYLPSASEVEKGRKIVSSEWKKLKKEMSEFEPMDTAWAAKAQAADQERAPFLRLTKQTRTQFAGTRIAPALP